MSDVVDAGVSTDSSTTTAVDVPEVAPSPANDPTPTETPAMPQPVIEPVQPLEAPVIHTPPEMPQPPAAAAASLSIKDRAYAALEKIRFNKRRKLGKIVALARKNGRIKNDDVEKHLKVSHATATNYLNQLVLEVRLKRVGSGHQPYYEPL